MLEFWIETQTDHVLQKGTRTHWEEEPNQWSTLFWEASERSLSIQCLHFISLAHVHKQALKNVILLILMMTDNCFNWQHSNRAYINRILTDLRQQGCNYLLSTFWGVSVLCGKEVWRGRGRLISDVSLFLIISFTHAEKLLNKENALSKLFFRDRSGAPSGSVPLCAAYSPFAPLYVSTICC